MPTDYTDYSVPQFAQGLTNQAMNLYQLLGQQKREARLEQLQQQQGIMQQFQSLSQIGKAPAKLRGPLFDAWAQSYEQLQGRPMHPDTREVWKKALGDDDTQGAMLDTLGEVLKGNLDNINPRTFAPLFEENPLKAFEFFSGLTEQAGFQKAMKDRQAGVGTVPGSESPTPTDTPSPTTPSPGPGLTGAIESRVSALDKDIAQFSALGGKRAKEFVDQLQQERTSLVTRLSHEQTKSHQAATESQAQANLENTRRHQAATEAMARANLGVSQANLGVSRANLGLRQQEVGLAKSNNPTERYAAELFDKPFAKLTPEQRSEVNQRVEAASLERAQQVGAAAAQNRPLPAQQAEELSTLQSSLDMLAQAEQLYDPKFHGPLRGGAEAWAMEKVGGMSEKEIDYRAASANFQNLVTKIQSGTAVSASEMLRLQKQVPLPTDRPEQAAGKRRIAKGIIQNALKRRQEALRGSGYGQVPSFSGGVEVVPGVTVEEIQ